MSLLLLYGPLTAMTLSLTLTQFASPIAFMLTAKTWLRILCLNTAFNGGIHYGIGAALFEISSLKSLQDLYSRQVIYSLIPGVIAFGITEYMILTSPLTLQAWAVSFLAMSTLQVFMMLKDRNYVKNSQAPKWYPLIRIPIFIYLIVMTVMIYGAIISKLELVQKDQPDRIETLKYLMKLDDTLFLQKVNELNIQYDEHDLKIMDDRYKLQEMRAQNV